jgi:hypothetical protein
MLRPAVLASDQGSSRAEAEPARAPSPPPPPAVAAALPAPLGLAAAPAAAAASFAAASIASDRLLACGRACPCGGALATSPPGSQLSACWPSAAAAAAASACRCTSACRSASSAPCSAPCSTAAPASEHQPAAWPGGGGPRSTLTHDGRRSWGNTAARTWSRAACQKRASAAAAATTQPVQVAGGGRCAPDSFRWHACAPHIS